MALHTEAEFTGALEAAVAERGADWEYPTTDPMWADGRGCRYRNLEGEPACLIGFALDKLDLLDSGDVKEGRGAAPVLMDMGFPLEVSDAAATAQRIQDQGGNWGDALRGYRRTLQRTAVGHV